MFRRTVLVSAFLLLSLSPAFANSSATPPNGVIATRITDAGIATVTWLPPADGPADYYRVYGYTASGATLLTETDVYTAVVSATYTTYGVTAVRGGSESNPAQTCAQVELDQWLPVHTDC